MTLRYRLLSAAAIFAGFTATQAQAQTQPVAPAPSTAGDASGSNVQSTNDNALDDIVVTAQKRSENLQKVPLAITALTGDQLASSGVTNTLQLTQVTAGLAIRTNVGSFQPSIRGINTSSAVVENPTALYIDGVYLPQAREGIRPLNNLVQLAVLKGPQGTLFGRNATAGVIQITTRAPSSDFAFEFGTSLDNYLLSENDVYINGALGKDVTANLSAYFSTQGRGWGKNLTLNVPAGQLRYQYGFMLKVLVDLSPSTQVTLAADYMDRQAYSSDVTPYPGTNFSWPTAVRTPLPRPWDNYNGVRGKFGFHGGGGSVTINSDLGFAKLLSISSYRRGVGNFEYDESGGPVRVQTTRAPYMPSYDYTQELQLLSPKSGPFTWVVGAFYIRASNAVDPRVLSTTGPAAPLPTSAATTSTIGKEIADSFAPFGQIGWKVLPNTELTVGLRYTWESRHLTGSVDRVLNNGATTRAVFDSKVNLKKLTYRVALTQTFSEDTMAYASINTGIKSGGYNIFNPANPGYKPETITAYEVGFKTAAFDRRLRVNAEGFYYDYSNIQVIQFINGVSSILNGAKARLYGLDLDIDAKITGGLRATVGMEIESATFTDYNNAIIPSANPGGGNTLGVGNATGKRLPAAQNYSVTTALNYSTEGSYGGIDLSVNAAFNGDYFFEASNIIRQKPFVDLGASAMWTSPDKRFSVTLFGKNLLDAAVITQAASAIYGSIALYGKAPRTYGLSLRLKL